MNAKEILEYCPICYKLLSVLEIQNHVNKCIFLNSVGKPDNKRKRLPSPNCSSKQKCLEDSLITCKEQQLNARKVATANKFNNVEDLGSTEHFSKINDKNAGTFVTPLSKQMQPTSFDEFYGQSRVLGKNTFLRSLLERNEIPNMILWGPPGCGKTSLANIIDEICRKNPEQYRYIGSCAVDCGVKEIQNILATAKEEIKFGRTTVLFLDEIHRLNKKQQTVLLVQVVKGDVTLIGATTENPSFIMSDSFLSRCKVIVMEKLEVPDLISIVERALTALNIRLIDDENTVRNLFLNNNHDGLRIQRSAIKWLAETTDGDARIALNNLQLILQHNNEKKLLTVADIKDGLKKSHLLYDRNGEEHHNIISAMHESIKGYNDNAALYWTARMIVGGEDPLFLARRLVRAASEDTGNADPKALQLAVSTMHGCQLLGMPEADILLAQCAVYLARAPTTKQTKSALALAKQVIGECKGQQPEVPVHLRHRPPNLMKELGYAEPSTKTTWSFMPAGLENVKFL